MVVDPSSSGPAGARDKEVGVVVIDEGFFAHERALIESHNIGPRTRIWAFAHIMDGAEIGEDCNICDHVFVESGAKVGSRVTIKNNALIWDGVTIEDDVFIGPNVVFTNDLWPRVSEPTPRKDWLPTLVQNGASIGANVTVVCGIVVGRYAMVGAGGVVVKSVADHALVVGSPARQIGWVCRCGRRLPESLVCLGCGRRYRAEVVEDSEKLVENQLARSSPPSLK